MCKLKIIKDSKSAKTTLQFIHSTINIYNKLLYKYTHQFIGRQANVKINPLDIPKKFLNVNEYIKSKSIWKQILVFHDEIKNTDIDMYDYLNSMMQDWHSIAIALELKGTIADIPNARILFSSKMLGYYNRLKEHTEKKDEYNKLYLTEEKKSVRLSPSKKHNINSLFKLKQLNPDLSYKEIVSLFIGKFDDDFRQYVIDNENITKEKLLKLFD